MTSEPKPVVVVPSADCFVLNTGTNKTESVAPVKCASGALVLMVEESSGEASLLVDDPNNPIQFHLNQEHFVVKMENMKYMIPSGDAAMHGVVLPATTETASIVAFEEALATVTNLTLGMPQLPNEQAAVGNKSKEVAASIEKKGAVVAKGIISGSQKAGAGVQKLGSYLTANVIKPKEKPVEVSQAASRRISKVKQWTGKALAGSRYAVSATTSLFKTTSNTIVKAYRETNYAKRKAAENKPDGPKMVATKEIGGACLTSAVDIYYAMKTACLSLMEDVKETTVDVAGHRYGGEVQAATKESLDAVSNLAIAAVNINGLATGGAEVAAECALETADNAASMEEWLSGDEVASGILIKQNVLTRMWRPRWAVLRTTALVVYDKQGDTHPSTVIAIEDIRRCDPPLPQALDNASDPKGRTLTITTRDHVSHSFQFPDEAMFKSWVPELRQLHESERRTQLLQTEKDL